MNTIMDKRAPDFRQTARLSWDQPRRPYRPTPGFVPTITVLLALAVLVAGIAP